MIYIYSKSFFPRKTFGFEADQEDEISDEDEDDGLDENDSDCHTIRVSKKEKSKDPIALDNGFFLAKFPQFEGPWMILHTQTLTVPRTDPLKCMSVLVWVRLPCMPIE